MHGFCYAVTVADTADNTNSMLLLAMPLLMICSYWQCHGWCYAVTGDATAGAMLLLVMPLLAICCYWRCHSWRYAVTGNATAGDMLLLVMPLLAICCYWRCHCWHYAVTGNATAGALLLLPLYSAVLADPTFNATADPMPILLLPLPILCGFTLKFSCNFCNLL